MGHEETANSSANTSAMDVADQDAGEQHSSPDDSQNESGNDGKKIKQLTLRLPEEYHRKLKILAACSGKSMTEILVGCIDERLEHCLERELKNVK